MGRDTKSPPGLLKAELSALFALFPTSWDVMSAFGLAGAPGDKSFGD